MRDVRAETNTVLLQPRGAMSFLRGLMTRCGDVKAIVQALRSALGSESEYMDAGEFLERYDAAHHLSKARV